MMWLAIAIMGVAVAGCCVALVIHSIEINKLRVFRHAHASDLTRLDFHDGRIEAIEKYLQERGMLPFLKAKD